MAQHSNEHLTITELSAYLDKELTPEELALCDAHIQTCQPCQAALADLRLTSALLGSMPQVAVPRSFVLPTNIAVLPETPPATLKTARRSSSLPSLIVKRTLRVVSTLAAVLGLFFILAGALSVLPRGMNTSAGSTVSTTSAHAPSNQSPSMDATSRAIATGTTAQERTPHATGTFSGKGTATSVPSPALTPTSAPPYSATKDATPGPTLAPTPDLPDALNLSLSEGRLTIGSALFLLGLLGVVMSRLGRRNKR